jgi:hypothetical protein
LLLNRASFAIALAFCFLGFSVLHADDAPPAQTPDAPADLVLAPGPHITLELGEQTELGVFDNRVQKVVDPATITWTVNGQAIGQLDAAMGTLVPAGGDSTGSVVYKAPDKLPFEKTIDFTATFSDSGTPVTLKGDIVLIDEPNWFLIDGDTGIGRKEVSIQLGSLIPSNAGMYAGPFTMLKGHFIVQIHGNVKGDPKSDVNVGVDLGPFGQPGTYEWHVGQPYVGADIACSFAPSEYVSHRMNGSSGTLVGSTTILKPDANDPPGLVKGFFSGQMAWSEMNKTNHSFQERFITTRGHFALPGTGQPAGATGNHP